MPGLRGDAIFMQSPGAATEFVFLVTNLAHHGAGAGMLQEQGARTQGFVALLGEIRSLGVAKCALQSYANQFSSGLNIW